MSDFKAKMHQIRFRLGLRPRRWGSLQCSPDPLAGFEGPTSKGGEGRDDRGGEGGEGRGEDAFLVMWPSRLSPLNPPLLVSRYLCCYKILYLLQNNKITIKKNINMSLFGPDGSMSAAY